MLEDVPRDAGSIEELIHVALTEEDEDIAWKAVGELHRRGTPEVFAAARDLCRSSDADERALGADILGQLGTPERPFREESVALLQEMLRSEEDPEVLHDIGIAFGHLADPLGIEPLSRLKDHPDADVREAVAWGIHGHDDALAIATLIYLTRDENRDVRTWAAYGLASPIDADTPEIRQALARLLVDEEEDIRAEAIQGLAKRGDPRAWVPLQRALTEVDAEEDFYVASLLREASDFAREQGADLGAVAAGDGATDPT